MAGRKPGTAEPLGSADEVTERTQQAAGDVIAPAIATRQGREPGGDSVTEGRLGRSGRGVPVRLLAGNTP